MTDPNEQDCPVCRAPMLWKYLNTRRCPKCNPLTGHKFDGLRGLDYSDRALGIAASFKSMLTDWTMLRRYTHLKPESLHAHFGG